MDTILGIPLGESYSSICVLADLSLYVKIYQQNPYSVEVHYRFSLFSAIWDCLHCIKALRN